MIKRIKAAFLALAMMFSVAIPALGIRTEATEVNGISVSSADVSRGEEFSVYIGIPASQTNADSASVRVEFTSDAFVVSHWESGIAGSFDGQGDNYFACEGGNSGSAIDLSAGITLSAVLRVKEDAVPGSYEIGLKKASFAVSRSDGQGFDELWAPTVWSTSVTVNSKAPKEPAVTGGGISSVSRTELRADDTFDVTVSVPAFTGRAEKLKAKVAYDTSFFSVTGFASGISGASDINEPGAFGIELSGSSLGSGYSFTAHMKVLSSAGAGTPSFTLSEHSITYTDEDNNTVERWEPSVTGVPVTVTQVPEDISVKDGGLQLSGDSTVLRGSTFTVTVNVPALEIPADVLNIKVSFDQDSYRVKSCISSHTGIKAGKGSDNFSASLKDSTVLLKDGFTLTAVLEVLNDAPVGGDNILTLEDSDIISTAGGIGRKLWEPTITSVSVTIDERIPVTTGGGLRVTGSANAGERFTVCIDIPQIKQKADDLYIRLDYPDAVFSAEYFDRSSLPGTSSYIGNGYCTVSASPGNGQLDLRSGAVLKWTFAVKKGVQSGRYPITITEANITGGYAKQALWTPLTSTVMKDVSGAAPVSTTSDTTPSPYYGSNPAFPLPAYAVPAETSTDKTPSSAETKKTTDSYGEDEDDEPEEDPDFDKSEEDHDTTKPPEKHNISLDTKLTGLSAGKVRISTMQEFFSDDIVIELKNTDEAETMALRAMRTLGFTDHPYYSFDISVYEVISGRYIHSVPNGYIEFNIPIPAELGSAAEYIKVYHAENGIPEFIESKLINSDGQLRINFRSNSFSPYFFVDSVHVNGNGIITPEGSRNNGSVIITPEGSRNNGGIVNPNTGVAAAVLIPASLVGCAFLVKKGRIKLHSKRKKKYLDE